MSKINTTTEFRAILKNETVFREVHGIDLINRKALVYISGSLEWIIYKKGTLCQFTGLEDKEGNKIFEGDILATEGVSNVIVKFGENDTWIGWYCQFVDSEKTCHFNDTVPYTSQVIGDIFTTPELLKA